MTLLGGKTSKVIGLCECAASPLPIWRKLIDIFPYWQGDVPRFELHIKALADIKTFDFVYTIETAGDTMYQAQEKQVRMSDLKEGERRSQPTRGIY